MLWRFKWIILLTSALGLGAGIAGTRLLSPEYLAQATVWIDVPDRRGAPDRGPIRQGGLLEADAWVDLLRSYVVLDAVARERRLYFRAESPGDSLLFRGFSVADPFRPGVYVLNVAPSGTYVLATKRGAPVDRGRLPDSIGGLLGFRWAVPDTATVRDRTIEFSVSTLRDAARQLERALNVRMDLEGNFLRVELRGADPEGVAATLNAVLERYVRVAAQLKSEKLTELTRILDDQLRVARDNLRGAEAALEGFRVQTIALPSDRPPSPAPGADARDPVFTSYFEMQIEREQTRRDREAIERLLSGEGGSLAASLTALPAVAQTPELAQALKELGDKQAEERSLGYRYSDEYPPLRRLREQIAQLEGQTIPRLARGVAQALAVREAELGRQVDATTQDLRRIPPRAIEEARLRRSVALAEQLFTTLQERAAEAKLAAEASGVPDIRILDAAVVPQHPVKNSAPRMLLMALLGGLAFGIVGAMLLDRMDTRVRYPEQVSSELGLPILGVVPHLKTSGDPAAVIEGLRGLCLNLVHAYGAAGPLLVTITSPGPGDGKSFLAGNLALTFAAGGHRTLLLDADLRRGVLHRRLNVARRPGLADYLESKAGLSDVLQSTMHPALDLIPSGTRLQTGPELLGSRTMNELIHTLRSQYAVLVVDSPPLGAGVDPFILSTLTGSLLMVLRAGYSHRDVAEAKLEVLRRLPVRILGAVVNDAPAGAAYGYYSYYLPGYEALDEDRHGLAVSAPPRII